MKELSGFTVWKCIHFFLIVWIICLKEEATQSFVLLFSWSHLTLQFENAWNNILSELKTSPKRYGHLKMPTLSVQTKHWHLLYECFREKIENVCEKSDIWKSIFVSDKKRTQAPDVHITFAGCHFGWAAQLYWPALQCQWALSKNSLNFPKTNISYLSAFFLKNGCNNSFGPKVMFILALLLLK